jgi:hypothetical protein
VQQRFRGIIFLLLFLLFSENISAARTVPHTALNASTLALKDSIPNKSRLWIVGGSHAAIWAGCFTALNKAWYADYPRGAFHLYNDNAEWLQMDKIGHVWTAYLITRLSTNMWRWTGLPEKKAVLLGGIGAIAFQSIIEIQDGYSTEWGFSPGDMAANFVGAAAYVSQEMLWKEQRLLIKFSSFPHQYPNELLARRNNLFGQSFGERVLKDYNGQTYWISGNIASFFPDTRLPRWLNVSVGYGGRGMLGGTENAWKDAAGIEQSRPDIQRTRHFYLAPDIDLSRIKTSKKWLASVLSVVNVIKIPAPAIEIGSGGKFRIRPLQF